LKKNQGCSGQNSFSFANKNIKSSNGIWLSEHELVVKKTFAKVLIKEVPSSSIYLKAIDK